MASEAELPLKKLQALLNIFLKIQYCNQFGGGKSKSELFMSNVLRYKPSQGKIQVQIPSAFELSLCGMFRFRVAVKSLHQGWLWGWPHAAMIRYHHTCALEEMETLCLLKWSEDLLWHLCDWRPPSRAPGSSTAAGNVHCQVHKRNI